MISNFIHRTIVWGHQSLCGMGGKSEMKVHTISQIRTRPSPIIIMGLVRATMGTLGPVRARATPLQPRTGPIRGLVTHVQVVLHMLII